MTSKIKKIIAKLYLRRKITIKTLNHYLPNRFAELFPDNMFDPEYDKYGDYTSNEIDLIWEIESYGLIKIRDLEAIIKDDLISVIKQYKMKLNYLSLMRLIMVTYDFNRYFKGLNTYFVQWNLSSFHSWENILLNYNITPEMIDEKIKEQEIAEQMLKEKKINKNTKQ